MSRPWRRPAAFRDEELRQLPALVGIVLAPSALLYGLHFLIFRDVRDVEFYTLMDLAFLPIQAILVSVVLETFLSLLADLDPRR